MSARLPPELLAAFDRSGDPLDDPQLQHWLQLHPEHLAEFALLRAQLRGVADVSTSMSWPRASPWWRRPPFLVLGAAVAIAVAGITWRTASASSPMPRPRLAPRSAVRSVVVSSSSAAGGESVVDTFAHGALAGRETSSRTFSGGLAPTLKFRSTLSIQHSVTP